MAVIKRFTGTATQPHLEALAHLRLTVFYEFPYLYEGTLSEEQQYLHTFFAAPDSVLILAIDGDRVVGASTGLPMEKETPNIQAPWLEKGYDLQKIFYFGESVLLPEYRGQGIGVRFFEEREAWARQIGRFETLAFCGVIRPDAHPRRPADYQPLDQFWKNRGFQPRPDMTCYISWKDLDEERESAKPLQFWEKSIFQGLND